MERKYIHPEGPEFSRVVAGVWNWTSEEINERMIYAALDEGITTFDHADIYGGYSIEGLFGNVLKRTPELRERIELVTKCGIKLLSSARPQHNIKHYDTSYERIIASVNKSLENFGTDYLNLLLIHRPDPLMNGEEIAKAFSELQRSGKVQHFGVSNFTCEQFEMLQSFLPMPLVTNQVQISLFKHELLFNGVLDSLMKQRISPMAWSPLGNGKFFQEDSEVVKSLAVLCEKYNATIGELLYAWLLAHPSKIFPVTGTTKPERLKEAVRSLSIQLDKQDWFAMLKLVAGRDVA
jgi:predicted oxidoreductase